MPYLLNLPFCVKRTIPVPLDVFSDPKCESFHFFPIKKRSPNHNGHGKKEVPYPSSEWTIFMDFGMKYDLYKERKKYPL